MKKKISLVVAVLVLVLGLAGCGNAKTVSYDKDTLIQSCDAVFDIIERIHHKRPDHRDVRLESGISDGTV
ncbi:MAG: hypothetical protein ACLU92_08870 [Coprococcus comes]